MATDRPAGTGTGRRPGPAPAVRRHADGWQRRLQSLHRRVHALGRRHPARAGAGEHADGLSGPSSSAGGCLRRTGTGQRSGGLQPNRGALRGRAGHCAHRDPGGHAHGLSRVGGDGAGAGLPERARGGVHGPYRGRRSRAARCRWGAAGQRAVLRGARRHPLTCRRPIVALQQREQRVAGLPCAAGPLRRACVHPRPTALVRRHLGCGSAAVGRRSQATVRVRSSAVVQAVASKVGARSLPGTHARGRTLYAHADLPEPRRPARKQPFDSASPLSSPRLTPPAAPPAGRPAAPRRRAARARRCRSAAQTPAAAAARRPAPATAAAGGGAGRARGHR